MTEEQLRIVLTEMKEHVADVIRLTVNGKIDGLRRDFNAFVIRAEPAVKVFENLTWFKKVIIGVLVFLGSVATVWSWLQGFIIRK